MQPHRRILARCRTRGRLSGSMRRCSCSRSTTHRRATPTPSISSRHCRAPLGNATDRRANASIVVFVCCGAGGACCLTRCGVSCCCVLPTACRIWCEISRGCACCIAAAFGTAADAARQQLAPLVRQAAVQRGRKCVPPARSTAAQGCEATQQRILQRPNAIAPVAQRTPTPLYGTGPSVRRRETTDHQGRE